MVARLRIGDKVAINAGNHKGLVGTVAAFSPDRERVAVEGVPTVKRHRKALPGQSQGEIVQLPRFVHVSNVCPADGEGKPSRIRVERDGKQATRTLVRTGEKVTTA